MHSAIAQCACGAVAIELMGRPIVGAVCYCDDCQAAARMIEAMPNAAPFRTHDGGTPAIIYRKDRIRHLRGREHLQKIKLKEGSPTNRWIADCCNSMMLLDFDDSKHWVDIYRARFVGDPPPLNVRICTRFATGEIDNPEGIPAAASYPAGFIIKLILARLAMALPKRSNAKSLPE
jgi:hypothetical protein